MEEQSYSFRTALNGFRREDVVSYLYRLNTKHEAQLAEKDEAIRRLTQENRHLQEALQKKPSKPAVSEIPKSSEPSLAQKELEAYRRAEQFERETRKWSEQVYNELLDDLYQSGDSLQELHIQVQKLAQNLLEQSKKAEEMAQTLENQKNAPKSCRLEDKY